MNMEKFEMVEKLSAKAGVTYEEAKEALENNNWNMLDAIVQLEKEGKTQGPINTSYSTSDTCTDNSSGNINKQWQSSSDGSYSSAQSDDKDGFTKFFEWCSKWLKKGNSNYMYIEKNDKEPNKLPITALVLLLLFAFWIVVPLMVVGLFLGYKYSFGGSDLDKHNKGVNDFMEQVSSTADNIKQDIKGDSNK